MRPSIAGCASSRVARCVSASAHGLDSHIVFAQEGKLAARMLDHGRAHQQREMSPGHGLVEIASGPQIVADDPRRIEADGLGCLVDHGLINEHEIGARCGAWQP
jgi:hypothetical protein